MQSLLYYPHLPYNPDFGFSSVDHGETTALIGRIASAYRQEHAAANHGASLWRDIDRQRSAIDDVLLNGTCDEIQRVLERPARGNLLYGFENTFSDYVSVLHADASRRELEARWIHDAATRLAQALGALKISGPEAPHLEAVVDVPSLVALIESRCGFELRFPNPFDDEFGVETGKGKASLRAIHAVYQAFRLHSLSRFAPGRRVLEIGAGLGRTAYFASKLFDMPYTIYDLPLTNVAQAYFLGTLLGEDKIALSGEVFDPGRHRVRILSTRHPLGGDDRCDILLNADSLTELDRSVAEAYVDFASAFASIFVSINHEGHAFTVAELMAERGALAVRQPYWMRKGYVEEIFVTPTDRLATN